MSVAALNTVGQILNLIGILTLFFFGMPFHVPTGGRNFLIWGSDDKAALAKEKMYTVFGYLGLVAAVLGTVLQIVAANR